MKWGITGSQGMLALDVQELLKITEAEFVAWSKSDLDITNLDHVREILQKEKPHVLINCAAFTNVDEAEIRQKLAFEINATGPKYLAKVCHELEIKMIHISTDFVFDGYATSPYPIDSQTAPINRYGQSKLHGENAVLQESDFHLVLRVSWLYGKHGTNFVKTMIELAKTKEKLHIVSDQQSSPTWTKDLANALLKLGQSEAKGVLHYSNTGICSWYDFACEIFQQALQLNLIENAPEICSTLSKDYATLAERPAFSALDTSKYSQMFDQPPHWKDSLAKALSSFS